MPMPISNLDEYDKVINVSWFSEVYQNQVQVANDNQIPMCSAFLSDVSSLLH